MTKTTAETIHRYNTLRTLAAEARARYARVTQKEEAEFTRRVSVRVNSARHLQEALVRETARQGLYIWTGAPVCAWEYMPEGRFFPMRFRCSIEPEKEWGARHWDEQTRDVLRSAIERACDEQTAVDLAAAREAEARFEAYRRAVEQGVAVPPPATE
jgi:hypothetical protein